MYITGGKRPSIESNLSQAYRQISSVDSSRLCVRLAVGGDPTYAFNVRFTGEEVHGTSKCPGKLNSVKLYFYIINIFS